jgi:hypothetical protein
MANRKISQLTELTSLAAADKFPVVDDSESSVEKTKYVDFAQLQDDILNDATTLPFTIGGVAQVKLTDGVLAPETDNDIDIGDASHQIKNIYLKGNKVWNATTQNVQTVTASGTTLDVTGLTAWGMYEVFLNVAFVGSNKVLYLTLNGDTGANYSGIIHSAYYTSSTGGSDGLSTFGTGLNYIPLSSGPVAKKVIGKFVFMANGAATQVLVNGDCTYYGDATEYGKRSFGFFYSGSADVTQFTITTNGTSLSGWAVVKRIM